MKKLLKLYTMKIRKKGLSLFEYDITMNINYFKKINAIKIIENEIVFNKEYCLKYTQLLLDKGFSDYQIRSIYENEFTPTYFHNEIISIYTNNSFYTFDKGYITFNDEYRLVVSSQIGEDELGQYIRRFENYRIDTYGGELPRSDFMQWHRENIFKG